MTNDEKLAKRVVEGLGIGESNTNSYGEWFCAPGVGDNYGVCASKFIRDGRVVLAAMEKCLSLGYTLGIVAVGKDQTEVEVCEYDPKLREHRQLGVFVSKDLGPAILEAICDAMECE